MKTICFLIPTTKSRAKFKPWYELQLRKLIADAESIGLETIVHVDYSDDMSIGTKRNAMLHKMLNSNNNIDYFMFVDDDDWQNGKRVTNQIAMLHYDSCVFSLRTYSLPIIEPLDIKEHRICSHDIHIQKYISEGTIACTRRHAEKHLFKNKNQGEGSTFCTKLGSMNRLIDHKRINVIRLVHDDNSTQDKCFKRGFSCCSNSQCHQRKAEPFGPKEIEILQEIVYGADGVVKVDDCLP